MLKAELSQASLSSNSFALLPGKPKIFHGRGEQLQHILDCLLDPQASRISILGPGGIGKSTLALSILHHPKSADKYGPSRHFVACDSGTSATEFTSLIAMHMGLQERGKPSLAVIKYFSSSSRPVLLVLDNFETPWEPIEFRSEIEELLSRLTDIPHLDLIVRVKGILRPQAEF